MIRSFTVHVNVADLRCSDPAMRRVAGLMNDNETVLIASMLAGAGEAREELSFTIKEAVALAELAFAGDERALTTPGLARKLCALSAILFRVCHAAGALNLVEEPDDGSGNNDLVDQCAANQDEDLDHQTVRES